MFFNGTIAFWLFVIGLGISRFLSTTTPEGKAATALLKSNQKAATALLKSNQEAVVEYSKSLQLRFSRFSENPSDIESLEFTLKALASFDASFDRSMLKKWMLPVVIPLLKLKPLDKSIRDLVFDYAKKTITISVTRPNEASSKEMYEASLEILSEHPEQLPLRQYALEVGRWHFGIQRPGRKVTIYDEQAIQNDIAVRSK
jgi:hypothetical protein